MAGWLVTDLYNSRSVQPQRSPFDGPRQISINNTEAVKVLKNTYYWSAPETYLGNKVSPQLESKLHLCLNISTSALQITVFLARRSQYPLLAL